MNKKLTILIITVIALLSVSSYIFNKKTQNEIKQVKSDVQEVRIIVSESGPIMIEGLVGGRTRISVGTQVRWTTDLIPSSSFTVDLGSSALPVQDIFTTNASISSNFEVGGTASISGTTTLNGVTYTWPSSDGSSTQFLQTNGSGTLVFATSGVASNSIDWDEIVDAMTLDANLTVASGSGPFNVVWTSDFKLAGRLDTQILSFKPHPVFNITAASDTIPASHSFLEINPNADYLITSTPSIASASGGTWLILHNTSDFTVTLQDEGQLTSSGIHAAGGQLIIEPQDTITFIFHGASGDDAGWHLVAHPVIEVTEGSGFVAVRNISGSTITAGTPVYQTGYNNGQKKMTIAPADADSTTTMPVVGLMVGSLANNKNGTVQTSGISEPLDTSAFSAGDFLYASSSAGELTATRPSTDEVQLVATVLRSNASNGVLLIQGAGRANDTDQIIDAVTASLSSNFEAVGYASASQFYLAQDGSVINAQGAFTFGGGNDAAIRFDGTDFIIETQGTGGGIRIDSEDDTLEFYASGVLQALFDLDGIDIITGNAFLINNTSVLNGTTLGSGVTLSSLTTLGTQTEDLVMGDFQITGIDNLTFTDTSGAIAGIENQNLVDKSASEAITGAIWTFGDASGEGIDVGSTGVRLTSDQDGAITFLGLSAGNDEDLTLNFDDTADTVVFTTSTGVTVLDLSLASMTLHLGTAGVSISEDGDGAITFLGRGDGNDEDFTINLDDTANTGVWSSSTGLVTMDVGTIGWNFEDATLEVPNSSGQSTGTRGFIGIDTASTSAPLRFHDGAGERVIDPRKCISVSLAGTDVTAVGQFTIFTADDPFTINSVQVTASGSNSLTLNLLTGSTTVPTTTVFTSIGKQASGSGVVTYTSFSDAGVADGEKVDIQISSPSATIDSVYLRMCMNKDS